MSVLACGRLGCDAVMCDKWSYRFGYICESCLDELDSQNPGTYDEIRAFMEDPKGNPPRYSLNVRDIFTNT